MAKRLMAGSLSAQATSPAKGFFGKFDVSLYGTWVATVALERSFD